MKLHPMVQALAAKASALRRDLHRIPETGFCEQETQAYLLRALSALHPDRLEPIAGTGVKAVFYADPAHPERPGRVTAFRSDIDGLAILEQTGAPYASAHEGRMHACGHDGHMAMLLTFAQLLSARRETLSARGETVVLLFQPAEEHLGGARRVIEEGGLENPKVERIFGLHLWPDVPFGTVGFREGPMMAQTCEFDVTVFGKSAHGASPHRGIDAIVAAAEIITAFQTIPARAVDPYEKAVLTIGKIQGGKARNIIAEQVVLNGTARSFTDEVYEKIKARIGDILAGVERAQGVRCTFEEAVHYPVLNNPPELYRLILERTEEAERTAVREVMAAEDFAFYQQKVPGMLCFIGVGDAQHQEPLHSSRFDFDERALLDGVELYRRIMELDD